MQINISNNLVKVGDSDKPKRDKGKSLLQLPQDYTVIDIETTGLSFGLDDILEISALKVRNNTIITTFTSLIKPDYFVVLDPFIEEFTGITTDMILQHGQDTTIVLKQFLRFVGNDIIIGHNVHFDINFLYDEIFGRTSKKLQNNVIDTYRLAKWYAFRELDKHTLFALSNVLGLDAKNYHRSEADAHTTFLLYQKIIDKLGVNWSAPKTKSHFRKYKATDIVGDPDKVDFYHPLYNAHVAFTGDLFPLVRCDAMQMVANLGGFPEDRVTKKTNFLVSGRQDPKKIKGSYSRNQKKALQYQKLGQDINVLDSIVFLDMIDDYQRGN